MQCFDVLVPFVLCCVALRCDVLWCVTCEMLCFADLLLVLFSAVMCCVVVCHDAM